MFSSPRCSSFTLFACVRTQHWHIYRKWNERLYQELLLAYKKGRSDTDPSENWYKVSLQRSEMRLAYVLLDFNSLLSFSILV